MTEIDKRGLALLKADLLEEEATWLRDHPRCGVVWKGREISADELDALAAILREAAEGWRPIETAPDDGALVWTWRLGWGAPELRAADGSWWRANQLLTKEARIYPTYWRPYRTPAPPAEEGK